MFHIRVRLSGIVLAGHIGAGAAFAQAPASPRVPNVEPTISAPTPKAGTATHVVVEPKGRRGLARLVPFDLVDATSGQLLLRCTEAEFERLDAAEETLAEFALGYQVPVQLLPPGWRDAGGNRTRSPGVRGA